uniref:Uncharacterized protein n=1 Tax=Astatotilapia calliptera TaxID=8154 RepID=A0A3P8R0G2_ASTCA
NNFKFLLLGVIFLDVADANGFVHDCLLSTPGEFQCAHGKMCIPEVQVCDGRWQCQDHSDEADCQKPIKSCEHRCADGKRCIPKKFLCDGEKDCVDGSDEVGCSKLFFPSIADFLCKDHMGCVSKSLVCDGRRHCQDGSDELNCPTETAPAAQDVLQCRCPGICKKGLGFFSPTLNVIYLTVYYQLIVITFFPSQVSFSVPMGKCASLRLRCVMGGSSVRTIQMNLTARNQSRAVSIVVLTGSAASQRSSCVMAKKTVWMAQMKWAAVSTEN